MVVVAVFLGVAVLVVVGAMVDVGTFGESLALESRLAALFVLQNSLRQNIGRALESCLDKIFGRTKKKSY